MNEALLGTITKLAPVGFLNVVLDEDIELVGATELARLLNVVLGEATELVGATELARLLNVALDEATELAG